VRSLNKETYNAGSVITTGMKYRKRTFCIIQWMQGASTSHLESKKGRGV